jgi:hypothetical protein
MNIANRKEYLTGRNGQYETDPITGVTPYLNTSQNYGKTNKVFQGGMTGEQLASHPNYSNPMNNLHNNIAQNVLFEQNMDNKVFIDAEYRNTAITDSKNQPFKFTVRFKDSEYTAETNIVTLEYNEEVYEYKVYVKDGREIIFPYVYHNVNYVIIDNLIMPSNIEFATQGDGSIKKVPGMRLARTQRYLVLKIDQFRNHKKVSNNPNLDNACFIMKNDDTSGVNNEFYIPIHDQVTAFQSTLPTIDRLDIEICDHKGKKLYPILDGEPHNFHKDYQESIEVLRVELEKDKKCQDQDKIDKLELRLISLRQIIDCIDPEIHLTINNVNQQINTNVKYRR